MNQALDVLDSRRAASQQPVRRYDGSMTDEPSHSASLCYRTYAANSSIASHIHATPSLTVVLGGGYEETIGGRVAVQDCRSALICPEGLPHAQRFGADGARKIIVTPAADLLDYLVTTLPFRAAPAARSTPIRELAARIDAERRTNDAFSRGAIAGLIWQVAAEMGRDLAGASVPTSVIVRRACAVIDAVQGQVISVAALCRVIDCHPATLTRAFRRELGCTPGEYQRRSRVQKAADMLKATRLPIAQVAADCGFCDQAHLARSFHAVLGCSPSEYRKRA
ncbi:helix-turn-helix domain-containing protein [Dyella koreensis]|uniref:Helix-turn-helix transcriptional regulator n=1 Tax=Dyella koreensis TaxID=311235 RepID=A0ABW8KCK8_9GAMM